MPGGSEHQEKNIPGDFRCNGLKILTKAMRNILSSRHRGLMLTGISINLCNTSFKSCIPTLSPGH